MRSALPGPLEPYRHNPLLDTLRLVRGVFRPRTADPFIGQWPGAIGARHTLFRWSDIAAESGDYVHRFDGYVPYVSPQPFHLEHLPDDYARDAFAHLMSVRAERVHAIAERLEADGIRVAANAGTWATIGDWIARHVESSREPDAPSGVVAGRLVPPLRPLWHSLTLDLTLLLGEQAIERHPDASWRLPCDTPYADASRYGRGLWLLLEPLPERPTTRAPRRLIPRQLMMGLAQGVLDGRTPAEGKRREAAEAGGALFAQVVEDAPGDP